MAPVRFTARVLLDGVIPYEGKPAHVRDVFDRLRAMVESFGPVRLVPYRDRVRFPLEIGGELRAWLREAYAIGCQAGAAVG